MNLRTICIHVDWPAASIGTRGYVAGPCISRQRFPVTVGNRLASHPDASVGAKAREYGGGPFEGKMKRLIATRREQQAEVARLGAEIAANLKELGYGG